MTCRNYVLQWQPWGGTYIFLLCLLCLAGRSHPKRLEISIRHPKRVEISRGEATLNVFSNPRKPDFRKQDFRGFGLVQYVMGDGGNSPNYHWVFSKIQEIYAKFPKKICNFQKYSG